MEHETTNEENAETGESGLERLQNITDDQIAAALSRATQSSAEREAEAMREPEPEPEPQLTTEQLGQVWGEALEDDFELAGQEEQIREVLAVYPELVAARTEDEARQNLDLIRHHVRAAEESVELSELASRQLLEAATERLLYVDDDVEALQLLDAAHDRLDAESFAALMEEAEGLSPSAALAFQSMLEQATEAERLELQAAREAAMNAAAAEVLRATQDEMEAREATLQNPRVLEIARELASDATMPGSPEEPRLQVRLAVDGAVEVDRLDRTNQFLDLFDRATSIRIPNDADRERVLAETAGMRPEANMSFVDEQPTRQQRVDAFGDTFDRHFARQRAGCDEVQQTAAKAEARAKEQGK